MIYLKGSEKKVIVYLLFFFHWRPFNNACIKFRMNVKKVLSLITLAV